MILKQKRQRMCCTDEFKTKEATSARSKRKGKIREKIPKRARREREL
jgi:hypothetical protein